MGELLGVLCAEKVVLVSKLGGEVAVDFPCFEVGLKNGESGKIRSGRMGRWADGGGSRSRQCKIEWAQKTHAPRACTRWGPAP